MDTKRRLGVFAAFDSDGVIDDYIPYLLNDLKQNIDRLIVIVNGKFLPAGRKVLEQITREVIARENEGYDFGAWRYALVEYMQQDELLKYDELVLLNGSCFGPLYPFRQIFSRMEEKDADFWGLVAHGEVRGENPFGLASPYGYLPAHYSIVICCCAQPDASP